MQHLNLKVTVLLSALIASRTETTSGNFHMVLSIQGEKRSMAKPIINLVIFIVSTCCTREKTQRKLLTRTSHHCHCFYWTATGESLSCSFLSPIWFLFFLYFLPEGTLIIRPH